MKKWFAVILLMVLIYAFRPAPPSPPKYFEPTLDTFGAVWFEANQSIAFLDVNTSQPIRVHGLLFEQHIPEKVWIWNASGQRFFPAFSFRLYRRLSDNGFSVQTTTAVEVLRQAAPGVLIVADLMPSALVTALPLLLEKGWVVVYIGNVFSERFDAFDFRVSDSLKGDYQIEVQNASYSRWQGWQNIGLKNGFLALHLKSLDQAWPDAEKAADHVFGFVLNASWIKPVAFFDKTISAYETVFSTPFYQPKVWGFVLLSTANRTVRLPLFLERPKLRMWTPSQVTWPANVPLSLENATSPVHLVAAVNGREWDLGTFVSSTGQLSTVFSSESLENNAYRINLRRAVDSRFISASFLQVRRFYTRLVSADFSAKTFYLLFYSKEGPLRFEPVVWRNQSIYTDAEGVAKFKDPQAHEGNNSYFVYIQDIPVRAEVFFDPPLFFSLPFFILAFFGCGALVVIAHQRARTFVFFHMPEPQPTKTIRLSQTLLTRIFDAKTMDLEQIAQRLCAGDPFLQLNLSSLRESLDYAVKKGWLLEKNGVYKPTKRIAT